MPVRIVKKEDVRKAYPPHGLPTKSNQTPDDFLFQVKGFSPSQSCAGLPILGEHGQPGKSFAEGAPNAKKHQKALQTPGGQRERPQQGWQLAPSAGLQLAFKGLKRLTKLRSELDGLAIHPFPNEATGEEGGCERGERLGLQPTRQGGDPP